MKVDIKKYLLEITIAKKTKKDLEKEKSENVQETSQGITIDETNEKIKYCKFLKQNILKKTDNKMYKRIVLYIALLIILYLLIATGVFNFNILLVHGFEESVVDDFENVVKKIIELLEFPMVLFLLFNITENEIQDKKINYDRKCKFIEVAQPLYIDGTLNNCGNEDIKDFYEKLINDNFEENDKDKPI